VSATTPTLVANQGKDCVLDGLANAVSASTLIDTGAGAATAVLNKDKYGTKWGRVAQS